jgi:hypothetical protein
MALPMVGLWVLIAHPVLDIRWLYLGAHFLIVSIAALISIGVGYLVNDAARRHGDVRLFLVGLAFLSSSGFLLMHALATPEVILPAGAAAGFEFGVPVGLALSGVFAAVSSLALTPRTADLVLRRGRLIQLGLLAVLVGWAAAVLLQVPPLSAHPTEYQSALVLRPLAVAGVAAFTVAVVRYYREYRQRGSIVLLSVLTAFLLLTEALIAIPLGHVWHLSWWLWHVLMLFGFGYVAYSAHIQYRHEGSAAGLFDGIGTQQTIARLRGEYGAALEALVGSMQRREATDDPRLAREIDAISAGLGSRFGLSEGQTAVLSRAAEALAGERNQITRLGVLVGIGREARVMRTERELLDRSLDQITEGFPRHHVQLGTVVDGRLRFPLALSRGFTGPPPAGTETAMGTLRPADDGTGGLVLPLLVKGLPTGVLRIAREGGTFGPRDRALLESLAAQLSIALENARLYRQIDGLFRQNGCPTT